nr:hypothetical protein [Tanacetum cinerariifolium]
MAAFNLLETQFQMFITSRIYLDDEYVAMTHNYFIQHTQLAIPEFRDTLIQHMESVKNSVNERALHKREYDRWVNERQMQTTEEKVDTSKSLDASLVDTESSRTESNEHDKSSRSWNDAHDDDADVKPIYDEEPMAEILLVLAGLTYELMKGSCKSLVELEFFLEEVYKATTDQLDWNNPEGQQYPHNLLKKVDKFDSRRTLCFQCLSKNVHKKHRHLKACGRPSTRCQNLPKKLNLTKPDTYHFDLKRKEAYTAYSNPRGFIYQNKEKQNKLMRIDKLHKFNDGTLNDVRTALDDRLKGIRIKYMPQTIWRKSDKEKAAAMIQAIDKHLKMRRTMRSLEKFVGGRLYEGDFRML